MQDIATRSISETSVDAVAPEIGEKVDEIEQIDGMESEMDIEMEKDDGFTDANGAGEMDRSERKTCYESASVSDDTADRAAKRSRSDPMAREEEAWLEAEQRDLQRFWESLAQFVIQVCSCCAESVQETDMHPDTFDASDSMLLPLNNKLHVTDSIRLCKTCVHSLQRKKVPAFALVNGFDFGVVPEELKHLTAIEQRMISLIVPFVTVKPNPIPGGQPLSKGHVINFRQDVSAIARKLPRPPNDIGVLLVRSHPSAPKQFTAPVSVVRVRAALLWLKQNNPLYSTVEIDEPLLKELELQEEHHLPTIEVELEERSQVVSAADDVRQPLQPEQEAGGDANSHVATIPCFTQRKTQGN